ncbi:hypothetical protein ZIOFF_050727 [Zingiber officinale]|uniref:Uncharacterized protein n=1 Tax=Zingiber officinale TaxID=94328 RepID=A0A8J5FLL2_ZINOF|nr:hypothetical protein ZIOFF_050727 [Zingiber officinale]
MAAFPPGFLLFRNPSATLYIARVAPRGLGLAKRARLVPADRRPKKYVVLSASHEEPHLDIELEKDDDDVNKNSGFSQEQWKEALNRFKVEALKVKAVSEKAYAVYSKKIMEMLTDKAEKLKIQADRAQKDLSILAQDMSKEGQEYLSATEKNYPDLIKEITEAYASRDKTTAIYSIREFYLGIPYVIFSSRVLKTMETKSYAGCFLSIGGFLYFMLTGSIPAIRFGVILGSAILALSVSSMRSWKNGKATPLLLIGQTAWPVTNRNKKFPLKMLMPCDLKSKPSVTILTLASIPIDFKSLLVFEGKEIHYPTASLPVPVVQWNGVGNGGSAAAADQMKRRPTEAGQITAIATVAQSRGRVEVEVRQWRPQQGDRRSRNSRRRRRRRAGLTLSSGVDSGSGVERKRLGEEANPAALAQPAALTLATVATARRERRPRGRGGMDLGHE